MIHFLFPLSRIQTGLQELAVLTVAALSKGYNREIALETMLSESSNQTFTWLGLGTVRWKNKSLL